MASNVREFEYTEKDLNYIRRLVYDVVMYTFRKYKIHADLLNRRTNLEANVYNRDNFVDIVGLSALRVSLLLRDKWKNTFIMWHRNAGFHTNTILHFFRQVVVRSPLSWNDTQQSAVEAAFALCNEILLFFNDAGIKFDIGTIIDAASIYIYSLMPKNRSIPETLEQLIGKIDNVSDYDAWITEFVEGFAISYGLRDVSDYFFEFVKAKWTDDGDKDGSEPMTLEELRDCLGFLPDDMFATIAYDDIPESLLPAYFSQSHQESSDSQKLPTISEDSAVEEETDARQPTETEKDSAETAQGEGSSTAETAQGEGSSTAETAQGEGSSTAETAQGEGSNNTSSEPSLEKALEDMSLGAGVSQECHGAIPKRKMSNKKKKRK